MQEDKFEILSGILKRKQIRKIWNSEKEEYYYSVFDVIEILTDTDNLNNYWNNLKTKLTKEGSNLPNEIIKFKLKSEKDDKYYLTDTLNRIGIFRLIMSIPSFDAQIHKDWLAGLGCDRLDEFYDPEIAINRAINYYRNLGYSNDWIENKLEEIIKYRKNFRYD